MISFDFKLLRFAARLRVRVLATNAQATALAMVASNSSLRQRPNLAKGRSLPIGCHPQPLGPVFGRPNGRSPAWRSATDMRTVVDAILYIASTARSGGSHPTTSHPTRRTGLFRRLVTWNHWLAQPHPPEGVARSGWPKGEPDRRSATG
jgi:hypothetical protein